MRINYNVSAMLSNNALANNDSRLAQSLERLSSGLKINHAKDNPAGLAMAKRMNAQLKGLDVANQNAGDGVSIIETADGALSEVSDMLQRMNELAVKAANGTMTDGDRATVQDEIAQLKEEIVRISEDTEFNGKPLLNGEFEQKGYIYGDLDVKVNGYTMEVPAKEYFIEELAIQKEMVTVIEKDADGNEQEKEVWSGNYTVEIKGDETGFPEGYKALLKDNLLTISAPGNFEMTLDLTRKNLDKTLEELEKDNVYELSFTGENGEGLRIDATGIGPMRLQIGSNEGQVLEVDIPAISLRNMRIEEIDVSTQEGADDAIERLDGAIKFLSSVRGKLGAYQNRLESTINSLDITSENMTAAYSRIMDVDMAEEMTQYTTNQVLTQAGTSMLAQANERPSQVLQLLQ